LEKPSNVYKYAQEYFSFLNREKEIVAEMPLVIAGPSGVGKGTLVKWLLTTFPDKFELSVSYTTRAPREGEINGREYTFVTKEEFLQEIAKNSFLEYCDVHGNFYGTHKGKVREIIEKNKICILEIDVQGAKKIKDSGTPCNFIFIKPPSIEILKQRLTMRGTDKEEAIVVRLRNAEIEIQFFEDSNIFNHHIINEHLDFTKRDLLALITKLYPKIQLHA